MLFLCCCTSSHAHICFIDHLRSFALYFCHLLDSSIFIAILLQLFLGLEPPCLLISYHVALHSDAISDAAQLFFGNYVSSLGPHRSSQKLERSSSVSITVYSTSTLVTMSAANVPPCLVSNSAATSGSFNLTRFSFIMKILVLIVFLSSALRLS